MNIARMLCIPNDVEKAIQLIKIGRTRKIDAGSVTKIEGEKLSEPHYFLETAGIGLDAQIQQYFKEFENGNMISLIKIIKLLGSFYNNKMKIITDDDEINTNATFVTVANGPYTGAAFNMAPDAKLNDHHLTLALYQMGKYELISYFFRMFISGKTDKRRIKIIKTKKVKILPEKPLLLHANATLFGTTPAEFKIIPSALSVICGFPQNKKDTALNARTFLDP